MKKRWFMHTPDPAAVDRISRALGCHPAVAAVLVNRNLDDPDLCRRFLSPRVADLTSPFAMIDMDKAADRAAEAVARGEPIGVFGDYDADGVTATALVTEFLRDLGARVTPVIPHRTTEGYGLRATHVDEMTPCRLIITVDCGVSSHDAADRARDLGVDLIVTDHHEPPETLPRALAVVNPKRTDCPSGLAHLAGVGVAFYFCLACRARLRDRGYFARRPEPNLKNKCDLVAIGTIADLVPVSGDNRILIFTGLEVLARTRRPGLAALARSAGLDLADTDARDIAFGLAPRINAAGRMAHADTALELLLTPSRAEAERLADRLEEENTRRKDTEREHTDSATAALSADPALLAPEAIVLWHRSWHPGVLGIVASRLVRRYFRPVILFGLSGGHAKGSGRSIEGVDLTACIAECADILEDYGGHAMAAGVSLDPENLPDFARRLTRIVKRRVTPDTFVPRLWVDGHVPLSDVGFSFVDEVSRLAPFGTDHPEPVFYTDNVGVASWRPAGPNARLFSLVPRRVPSADAVSAIWFDADPATRPAGGFDRLAFKVQFRKWAGSKTVQLVLESE